MRIDKNTTIRLGNRNIVKVKLGDVVIWQKTTEPVVGPDYFYIENVDTSDGEITFTTIKNYTPTSGKYAEKIEYSSDKTNWNTINFNTTTPQTAIIKSGEKVYLRNDSGFFNFILYSNEYTTTINTTKKCVVGGNLNSLLDYNNLDNIDISGKKGCFEKLFYNATNIIDASNLVMLSTLVDSCYNSMFYGCTSLTTAPALPATTLAAGCYQYMFSGCTSLTTAPELPATTLASSCYSSMFNGCTSLTTAPELPSTTLANYCYGDMFRGCTKLTTAPELPATTITDGCYRDMFMDCTKLTSAPTLPATTLKSYCYDYMFGSCKALTTAPELPATTLAEHCYSNMFYGCNSLTSAPELPATTLAQQCYERMFEGCYNLTTAPELPATTLASSCYSYMFYDCRKLKSITTYAKDISASNCTNQWLLSVSYSGTFNNMGFASFETGASGIPTNWTENIPPIQSITTVNPDTFTIEFNNETVTCNSTLTITTTTGITNTRTNSATLTVGENTGSTTRTITETIPYYNSSYDVTIVQSAIQSITANPDTFTIKSYKNTAKCTSTLTITTTLGTTVTDTNTATITVGENTGDTTRTLTETIPYKGSSYQVTIVQTANDVKPVISWNVESTGTYPFELNTNGYYESTNKGHDSSYSYATLNYSGFDELVLECINSGESNYDYGIISQPDVLLSESIEDDGATGSTKVFKNFKGESSTNPVQLTIPSDEGSHFITIKFRKDSSQAQGNDSLQFKVIEP